MRDTKLALSRWNREPGLVLRPWCLLSAAIAVALLFATYAVAKLSTPDHTIYLIPGYNADVTIADYGRVLFRNSLVLALHALACVAGFMAGSSLPLSAAHRSGISQLGAREGRFAIAFVVCATLFSLCTQAYIIGGGRRVDRRPDRHEPRLSDTRAAPARHPGAVRAVPPARGLDDREPPRCLARAAGGNVRHGRHRDPDPARGSGDRGLGSRPTSSSRSGTDGKRAARRPPRSKTASRRRLALAVLRRGERLLSRLAGGDLRLEGRTHEALAALARSSRRSRASCRSCGLS